MQEFMLKRLAYFHFFPNQTDARYLTSLICEKTTNVEELKSLSCIED